MGAYPLQKRQLITSQDPQKQAHREHSSPNWSLVCVRAARFCAARSRLRAEPSSGTLMSRNSGSVTTCRRVDSRHCFASASRSCAIGNRAGARLRGRPCSCYRLWRIAVSVNRKHLCVLAILAAAYVSVAQVCVPYQGYMCFYSVVP